MHDFSNLGKILIVTGIVIALVGISLLFVGKIPWPGKLPGDFFWRGKNFSLYVPVTTSILISIVLSVIMWFINRR